MNALKTDINGGYPWVLDDFRWHHDATRAALTAIIKGLNIEGANCRLQGVEGTYNAPTWDVSAGYLLVDGEIVQVDAQTGLQDTDAGFDYYYVTINETFDPAGNKALEDGGTGDAYKKRRGIINSGGTDPVGADLSISMDPDSTSSRNMFPTLASIIAKSTDTDWQTVSAATLEAQAHTNIVSIDSGSIRYKEDVSKTMFIEGFLTCDLGGGGTFLEITLPSALSFSTDYQVWGVAQIGSSTSTTQKIGLIGSKTGNTIRILSPSGETFLGSVVDISFSAQYRTD